MIKTLLAICMHTMLPCNEIYLTERHFRSRISASVYNTTVVAQAYMTNMGNVGIWLNEDVIHDLSDDELKEVFVHELAHLVMFTTEDHSLPPHGPDFQRVCAGIARKAGVNSVTACAESG